MGEPACHVIYTIGHSNHPIERFIALLRRHGVSVLADVRSAPYSGYCPQFNRESLAPALGRAGIAYLFLGRELGARREEPSCYEDGRVQFREVLRQPLFQEGIRRLLDSAKTQPVALMCAEKDPLDCHRMVLVCRCLKSMGAEVAHILEDGGLESQAQAEGRLVKRLGIEPTLFEQDATRQDLIERAYDEQAQAIACHAIPGRSGRD
jgi:uncharacterized protein (DUF488 family)